MIFGLNVCDSLPCYRIKQILPYPKDQKKHNSITNHLTFCYFTILNILTFHLIEPIFGQKQISDNDCYTKQTI
jgi:hypothetical protein